MSDDNNLGEKFTEGQGGILLNLARQTILSKFAPQLAEENSRQLETDLRDNAFDQRRGTFVTLKINGQLRGCIGNLEATESVRDSVRHNAVNAAFDDYRFKPLTREEFGRVDIEISILTESRPVEYADGNELLAKLRVGIDGVILRKGSASATFLPQVWKQLPKPADFLNHLCLKAGLAASSWQQDRPGILTYQVQYFEEH